MQVGDVSTIPKESLLKAIKKVKMGLAMGILLGGAQFPEELRILKQTPINKFYLEFVADPDRFPNVKKMVLSYFPEIK